MKGLIGVVGTALVKLGWLTFPARQRARYGKEPAALFRMRLEDQLNRRGYAGAVGLILTNLIDLIDSGIRARADERRHPSARETGGAATRASIFLVGRTLLRHPRFALLVAIPMGLSLGSASAAFSIIDAVVLRPLPIPDAERVVMVGRQERGGDRVGAISIANFRDLRERVTTLQSMHVVMGGGVTLQLDDGPIRAPVYRISEGTLGMLGATVIHGRPFVPADHREAGTVLISHEVWRSRWGGDPGVVGTAIRLNDELREIVGVLGPDVRMPQALFMGEADGAGDLWLPLDVTEPFHDQSRAFGFSHAAGLLPPGGSTEAVNAELNALGAGLVERHTEANTWADGESKTWGAIPLKDATVRDATRRLWLLSAAAILVLVIAIANSANLVLVRTSQRTREVALRMAIGASRRRVSLELLLESVWICAAAGFVGLLVAHWATDVFVRLQPEGIPRLHEIGIDARMLLFGVALALGSGISVGLVPAILVARSDIYGRLRASTATSGRGEARARSAFVTAQTAVALTLAVNASLLLTSLSNLLSMDRGFETRNLWAMRVNLPQSMYDNDAEMLRVFRELRDRVEALPGIDRATGSVFLLGESAPMVVEVQLRGEDMGRMLTHNVLPDFFETMNIPIVEGRALEPADHRDGAPRTAVLSRALAETLFPDGDALGAGFSISNTEDAVWTVVGIAENTRSDFEASEPEPLMYLPYSRWAWIGSMVILARETPGSSAGYERLMPATMNALDDRVPVTAAFRLSDFLSDSAGEHRFYAWLLSSFSALALVLAAIGLYATLSFSVSRRFRELAIRIALGADPRSVVGLAVRGGVTITAIGAIIGIGMGLASGRLLEGLLFDLTPNDPRVYAIACTLLFAVATLASWAPGRRAMRTDPTQILRTDS